MNKNWTKAIIIAGSAAVAVGILVCGVEYSAQIKNFVSIVVNKIKIKES